MKVSVLGLTLFSVLLMTMGPVQSQGTPLKPIDQLMNNARLKLVEGDKAGAAVLYHRALQMDGSNQEARNQLATLLVEAEVEEPAAEQIDVLQMIARNVAEPPEAPINFSLPYLDNVALKSEDTSMGPQVLVILQKLQNNDNEEAIKLAKTLKKQHPAHPVPYNLIGLAWQGLGDPSQARDSFEKALKIQENFHAARINLAELELNLGEFDLAHQELDTVLKQDNHNRRASLVKAQLYNIEGRSELAKEWYTKVSENL